MKRLGLDARAGLGLAAASPRTGGCGLKREPGVPVPTWYYVPASKDSVDSTFSFLGEGHRDEDEVRAELIEQWTRESTSASLFPYIETYCMRTQSPDFLGACSSVLLEKSTIVYGVKAVTVSRN